MPTKKLRIVLIAPRSEHSWESLGLGYIAAYSYRFGFTPEQYTFFHGQFDTDETIVAGCAEADLIGFSLTSFQTTAALALIREIRKINRRARIVWGGYAVHGLGEAELSKLYGHAVDCFVQGPGEEGWLEVLQSESPPRFVRRELMKDLNRCPFPDRELIRVDRHFAKLAALGEGRKTSMELQRGGCPFDCIFCAARSFTREHGSSRTAENMVAEMEELRDRWGMDRDSMVLMCDAEVFLTPEMGRLAELKKSRGVEFGFGMNVVASTLLNKGARQVLEKLVGAGLREVWMGVESGPSLMHLTGKPNTPDQIREAFRITREMGLVRKGYFILGFTPEETRETVLERIPFIEELDPEEVGFSLYVPVPGSLDYRHELHKGIDYASSCEYHNTFTRTKTLSNGELRELQAYLVDHFKERAAYRQRRGEQGGPRIKRAAGRSGC
ncbi:radical SAM protein [Geomonas sp. Red32]|uniref:B12-binding domain-containing radical SAM protein n=1 Tax=Geomonas sp. Red32 TaxID=2912856 RepID=UPI00202CB48A|nr:radical SAM protein [Geomonas sp. Red32]MCM0081191.1 radical SAM protein [Geomonas sp. Red32]